MANVDLARVGKNLLKSSDSEESVELQSLWQHQPVVLFFLRRFGCQVCRWTASEISKLEPDLRAGGVALVGVGPEEFGLKEFKEKGFFKGSIYVDEQKKSYKDLGFKRYTALSVVPAALGKKVRDAAAKVDRGHVLRVDTVFRVVVTCMKASVVVFSVLRPVQKESRETSPEICCRAAACLSLPKVEKRFCCTSSRIHLETTSL
uniref:Prostamide/prostaglandin F synthase n=1 Tax=Scophthalmus maximus TaxID=52904 RepID=A0A8D3AVU8_SCOMX